MAQLFWKSDLEQLSVDASRVPAKQKLTELKNHYDRKEHRVLFLIQSDRNTRTLSMTMYIGGFMQDRMIRNTQTALKPLGSIIRSKDLQKRT